MTMPPVDDQGQPPRDWLGWSLVATILCFLPVGLVALAFGLRTNRAIADGRMEEARRGSAVARRWLIATVVAGLIIYAFLALLFLALGAFSS